MRNPNLGLVEKAASSDLGWQANLGRSRIKLGYPRNESWWTGKAPQSGICPGVGSDGRLRSLPIPNLSTCSRQDVQDYFDSGWTLTEVLFSGIETDEGFYRPPYHGLRHPLIFYYAHPAVLYVNKLRVAGLIDSSINEEFESLFETGVDEMSWDDMSKNEIEWPTLDDVLTYRRQVYELVSSVIASHPELDDRHPQIDQDSPLWALFLGFEHERIHIETSSVLIRELPVHLLSHPREFPDVFPLEAEPIASPRPGIDYPENEFEPVSAGSAVSGKNFDSNVYGWDNEYGRRKASVAEFQASRFLVSNGEFWQFVADGGYSEETYWTETGWSWRCFRNVKFPTFWVPDGPSGSHRFKLRETFKVVPMQWSWPAVVNYHEAKAFLKWKSSRDLSSGEYRLLTEMEHHRLRSSDPKFNAVDLSVEGGCNLNFMYGSESPVDGHCSVDGGGFGDVFGNVWHWCEDHFNPLPGFAVHKYYDDFSTPCFDGEHQMILGGSFASTGDMACSYARFHFRPHFFQHAGFRVVYSSGGNDGAVVKLGDDSASHDRYKADRTLDRYIHLHYGDELNNLLPSGGYSAKNSFPRKMGALLNERCRRLGISPGRALDVGCAVGGASFEIARHFDQVTAVDLSEQFINFAKRLQKDGSVNYRVFEEGDIASPGVAAVEPDLASRVEFRRADACSLPAEFVDFDAVLIANVICRLPSPMSLIGRLGGSRGLVRPGGVVVISTPFTWNESFTPKQVWLGGFEDEQGTHWSSDGLKKAMGEQFELLESFDMPLMLRTHRRYYQQIIPLVTVWQRKV